MAEWLKAHDSKSCGLARVSKVRILSLPPLPDGSVQKAGLGSRCRSMRILSLPPRSFAKLGVFCLSGIMEISKRGGG